MHISRALASKPFSTLRSINALHIRPRRIGLSSSTVTGRSALARGKNPVYSNKRLASTSQGTVNDSRSLVTRFKNLFLGTVISASLVLGYFYVTDTRAGIHQWAVVPLLRWMYDDAEEAHEAGTRALKGLYEFGIHPRERGKPDDAGDLQVEVGNQLPLLSK